MKKSLICLLLTLFAGLIPVFGKTFQEHFPTEESLKATVSCLADDHNRGRASGTVGNTRVERYIVDKFKQFGLKPYEWAYTQSFRYKDSITLRNVVGILPATRHTDEYIVISAHYDHIGEIKGRIYNGADDNASGVAALLGLAESFAAMRGQGRGPSRNIIFVAFDGKELSMAGSRYFVRHLSIPANRIIADINMDIIGTDLVPTGKNPEYIMAIGEESLPEKYRGHLPYICLRKECRMDVCMTFYGSGDFTKIVYRNGDHWSFAAKGIPAVFFTSGFHQHTYKQTDDTDIINFKLLRKRTIAIYRYVCSLCSN